MNYRRFAKCIDNSDFDAVELMEGYTYEIFSEMGDSYLVRDEYGELTYIQKDFFGNVLTLIPGGKN